MKIVIYQIIPELDKKQLMFNSIEHISKSCGDKIPADIYEAVYSGKVEAESCDDLWRIFNLNIPKDYKGRSMSVSDVIEVIDSDSRSDFFFCDDIGFETIAFEKEKAMTFVSNHNFDYVCEKRKNVSVFFIGTYGLEQVKCKELEISRCKYSECQLGYRLLCKKIDGSEEKYDFSERPSIILSDCIETFPTQLLYADEMKPRFTAHDEENLGIVCAWLRKKGYKIESYYGGGKNEVLYRRKRKFRP